MSEAGGWPGREIMERGHDYRIGVMWSFVSAFLWGTMFVAARCLLRDGRGDPVTLSMIRFLIGGGILMAFGLAFCRERLLAVTAKDLLECALLGLFGVAGMSVLLFFGQQFTTAINGAMIMQVSPILILFAGTLIGERLRPAQIAGVFVSLFGCLMVVGVITRTGIAYSSDHLQGDLMVFLSACCWTVYTVAGKKTVERLGGFAATTWALMLGGLELALLRAILPTPTVWPTGWGDWGTVIYLAIFPSGVAFFAWYEAMNRIELSLLNVMQYLTPVVTISLAWLLLGERLGWLNGIGVALVLVGVVLTHERKQQCRR